MTGTDLLTEEREVLLANRKTTKAAKGAGTIRKRSDGRWEARYSLGFDPRTGKQIQRSVYGATQKEVRQKLTGITAEIDEGSYVEPSSMKLKDWLDTWLSDYTGNIKPATYNAYEGHVRVHIKPYLGEIQLSRLTAHSIQKLYKLLQEERKLSPKTVSNVHGVLHRALDQAIKLGYLKKSPLAAVVVPRAEKPQIGILEDENMKAFLGQIRGDPYELVLFVTVFTGMRQGEVLGLTWDCVDFQHGQLLINKQHNRVCRDHTYRFSSLKNDRARVLTASEHVMDALRRQQALQARWAENAGELWDNSDNLVFTNELGGFIKNKTLYMHFKRIAAKLGQKDLRFHALRHTYAVNSLRAGDDIKTVQENLGHATAAFTLSTYAHATPGMKRESANRMDAYIERLQSGVPGSVADTVKG